MPTGEDFSGLISDDGSIISGMGDRYAMQMQSMSMMSMTRKGEGCNVPIVEDDEDDDDADEYAYDDQRDPMESQNGANLNLHYASTSDDDGDDEKDESVISATSAVVSFRAPKTNPNQQRRCNFDDDESVISATSAFMPLNNDTVLDRSPSHSSAIMMNRSTRTSTPMKYSRSMQSDRSSTPNKYSSSRRTSTPQRTQRTSTPSRGYNNSAQYSTTTGERLLPSQPKPSSTTTPQPQYFKQSQLSQDSMKSIDSQELYALRMTQEYANCKEQEQELVSMRLKSSQKPRSYQFKELDNSSYASMDSQERYAMRKSYSTQIGYEESQLRKAKERQKRAATQTIRAELAEAEKELQRAKWEEQESAKRKAIKAADQERVLAEMAVMAERVALEKAHKIAKAEEAKQKATRKVMEEMQMELDRKIEQEAEEAARMEMEMQVAEQREFEAQESALEREIENAHKTRMQQEMERKQLALNGKPIVGIPSNRIQTQTIADDEDYNSDYSSESDYDDEDEDGSFTGDEDSEDELSAEEGTKATIDTKMNKFFGNADDRSIKSNLSSMSGSENEEDFEQYNTYNNPAQDVSKFSTDETKKKKKKVVMFSKGLGKGKTKAEITKKNVSFLNAKRTRRSKNVTRKTTAKNMKTTALRTRKTKVKRKKTASQMVTIRHKGKHSIENIVPTKTDKNAKVMRVCKLTTKGYVSAEFISVDPRNTPLHIACLTHYPEKFIIDHLMKSDRKADNYRAVFAENTSGELPIHYAVMDSKGVPPLILDTLLKEFPESVEHCNVDGSLPIHVACEVGAPSLYSIKKLIKSWPGSVMIQNDLQVPLMDEDKENEFEKELQNRSGLACCYDNFGIDWFGGNEINGIENFETGWTPIHLASVNGAEPEVIETILEAANGRCLDIQTNKGRTALQCAKWCIINAIINDVNVSKLQNTFASVQIMQSYDRELRAKDELVLKVGLINSALENSDSYGQMWTKAVEMMPEKKKEKERNLIDYIGDGELGLSDLHRVILTKGDPEEVQRILEENPECVEILSTHNRTPMEVAKHMIIKGLLLGQYVSDLTNTFISLEVMQAFDAQREDIIELDASQALSKTIAKRMKEKEGSTKFGSPMDNYMYTKKFVEMEESDLGRFIKGDNDSAIQPHEYFPPANLSHVNLRVTIPVGFRRFRRAFLHLKENFLLETVLQRGMGYKE